MTFSYVYVYTPSMGSAYIHMCLPDEINILGIDSVPDSIALLITRAYIVCSHMLIKIPLSMC